MAGRIVVLISGSGSNLDALIEACDREQVPGEVVAVFADRDCLGIKIAERHGIPAQVVGPEAYPDRAAWSEGLRTSVSDYEPDLVVSAGFMRILAPVFVDAFAGRLINLHPSLLPSFPGAHAVRDALEAGVRVTGTTVHLVDNEVDHGPIVLQEAVKIEPEDTEELLHERIKAVEHSLLPDACRLFLEGKVQLEGNLVKIDKS
jgi:phosphoribosylglycinamide formyltransferase-1